MANPNSRVAELLENLGVLHLFKLREAPLNLPEEAEARAFALDLVKQFVHAAGGSPGRVVREPGEPLGVRQFPGLRPEDDRALAAFEIVVHN